MRKRASRSARAWLPPRIIFKATRRFRPWWSRLVNDPHSALAEPSENVVTRDGRIVRTTSFWGFAPGSESYVSVTSVAGSCRGGLWCAKSRFGAPGVEVSQAMGGGHARIRIGGHTRFARDPGRIRFARGRLDLALNDLASLVIGGGNVSPGQVSRRIGVGERPRGGRPSLMAEPPTVNRSSDC